MAWIYALLSLSLLLLAYQNWSFGGTLFILSVVMLILARQRRKRRIIKRLATAGLLLCLTLKQKRYKMKEVSISFMV